MRLQDDIDFTTLTWVKAELDETLKQARHALEAYVEDPNDASQMRFCATYLHQVQGTLRMVELYGAAMVTEEMEHLASALLDNDIKERDDAYAVLMRGIVQLPDYLERLQTGHKDIPIVLLPLLNDLRAARGEKGLSEIVLFTPDLTRALPPSAGGPGAPLPELDLRKLAEALRAQFQVALLNWFRNVDTDTNVARIAQVCDRLVASVSQEEARRLFWVAGGVLEALRAKAFEPSPQLKQTIGRVEREIKRLADAGEASFRVEPPRELTRNLLYFVAHAPTDHGRIGELRQVFRLDSLLPTEAEIEHARGSISGHNRALLDTVSVAIKEDLMRVKDALDLHLRTQNAQPGELSAQVDVLDRVSDTLGMLGLGVARRVVQEQRAAVHQVATGSRPADEATLLDIAGALLYVEASLDDQVQHLGGGGVEADGIRTIPQAESRKVLEALIKEAQANFAQAKQCFVAFIESNWDHAQLQDVPRLLEEVSGAMRILEMPDPAKYLQAVRIFTEAELLALRRVPNGPQMDTLADALASLEYFLEAVREHRSGRERILEVTVRSLESLGYWPIPEAPISAPADVPETPPVHEPIASEHLVNASAAEREALLEPGVDAEVDALVQSFAQHLPPEPAQEAAPAPAATPPAIQPAAAAPIATTAETPEVDASPTTRSVAAAPVGTPLSGFDSASDEIDEEIREVFIEEVQEEINNLGELLPAWRANPQNLDNLKPIRRVFHTLKGSGRLVGALTLGEFSWKIENMLNRVLDATIQPTPAVQAIIGHAYATLPSLLGALRGEGGLRADIEGIKAVADRLAAGEEAWYTAPVAAVGSEPAVVATTPEVAPLPEPEPVLEMLPAIDEVVSESAEAGSVVSIDPVLFDILKAEVAGHLETIEDYLGPAGSAPRPATDPLLRAVHTMNGAFAMTDVPVITDVIGPLEGYIKRLVAQGAAPSAAGHGAMRRTVEEVRSLMLELEKSQPRIPDLHELASLVAAERDALPEPIGPALAMPMDFGEDDEVLLSEAVTIVSEAPQEKHEPVPEPVIAEVRPEIAAPADERTAPADDDAIDFEVEVSVGAEAGRSLEPAAEPAFALDLPAESGFEVEELSFEDLPAPALELPGETALDAELVSLDDDTLALDVESAFEIEEHEPGSESLVQETGETAISPSAGSAPQSSDADLALEAMIAAYERTEPVQPAEAATADLDEMSAAAEFAPRLDRDDDDAARIEVASATGEEPLVADWLDRDAFAPQRSEAEEDARREAAAAAEAAAQAAAAERAAAEAQAQAEREAREAEAAQAEAEAAERAAELAALEAELAALQAPEPELPSSQAASPLLPAEPLADFAAEEAEWSAPAPAPTAPAPTDDRARAAAAFVAGLAEADPDPDGPLQLADMDEELLDIFLEESGDILDHSDGLMARLRESPSDRELVVGLQRDLHTLKGGARMAGLAPIGDLGHAMESLLEAVAEGKRDLSALGVETLERAFDRLHGMVTRVGERRALAMPQTLIDRVETLGRGEEYTAFAPAEEADQHEEAAIPALVSASAAAPPPLSVPSAPLSEPMPDEDEISVRAPQEQIRIRADLLDRLVNYAGEVAIYRARLEQQLSLFRGNLGELEQTTARLREQLRKLEIETEAQIVARYQREAEVGDSSFDPLELDRFSTLQQLSRALSESAADIANLQGTLEDHTRQYETLLLQQSRVSSELQEGLMRTRMVPFDALVPRLRRIIRQTAGELGKKAQLKVEGAQGEMDRNVLDRMTAPLEHMLRNALAHGLELPDVRRAAGKPEEGTVRIAVMREGSEVVIKVSDDGRGLDRDAIRTKAIERGLLKPDAQLSDRDLYGFILETGFSTAATVSKIAGRGVGMDVVHSEIRQLGGSLYIESERGRGSEFVVRLPFTLAVTQAVFVKHGDTLFSVPISSVQGVARIDRAALDAQLASGEPNFRYAGEDYAIYDLGLLIGQTHVRAEGSLQVPLLLARSGDLRAAICVDQVIGSREIVVKPVGPQVSSIPGIFGATIMGDGRVIVILDVAPLVRRSAALRKLGDAPQLPPAAVEQRRVPLVMVVDDSITMRKVTGRVLERHNYEVITAKDGVDAIEKLQERIPDVMLLDIEMPRMDGYELATHMRNDVRLRGIPIIMITSRTGEKHRQRAFEIGVDRYLGKPYQENDLMRNVQEILKVGRGGAG